MADWLRRMHAGAGAGAGVDLPSGLDADTGAHAMRLRACARRRTR